MNFRKPPKNADIELLDAANSPLPAYASLLNGLEAQMGAYISELLHDAEIRKIRCEQARMQALADLLAARLSEETRCLLLAEALEETRAECLFREMLRHLSTDQVQKILEKDIKSQELWCDRELLLQRRKAISRGNLSAHPKVAATSTPSDPIVEEAHTPEELEKMALSYWADIRSCDPTSRAAKLAELNQSLPDRMAPYDAAVVLRRVQELLAQVG